MPQFFQPRQLFLQKLASKRADRVFRKGCNAAPAP